MTEEGRPPSVQGPKLAPEIDIPQGWRDGHLNRARLPDDDLHPFYDPFRHGVEFLAWHVVPHEYVCIVRRVEAGVFKCYRPFEDSPFVVDQIDELHWWSRESSALVGFPPPEDERIDPWPDWRLHLGRTGNAQQEGQQPPAQGTILPVRAPPHTHNLRTFIPIEYPWPVLRFGLVSYSAQIVIVGPAIVALAATWNQPRRGILRWEFGESWGLMEGVDLRYDSPEARRVLQAGFP